MTNQPQPPKVGVGILILKGNQTILGKRCGSHGAGEYGGAGGHMENGESFEEAILREISEEFGSHFKIKNLRFSCVTNLRKYAPRHYIDIGMLAEWESGEPKVMEPDKVEKWEWFDIDNPPPREDSFGCLHNYIEAYKTGKVYFEDT